MIMLAPYHQKRRSRPELEIQMRPAAGVFIRRRKDLSVRSLCRDTP